MVLIVKVQKNLQFNALPELMLPSIIKDALMVQLAQQSQVDAIKINQDKQILYSVLTVIFVWIHHSLQLNVLQVHFQLPARQPVLRD